VYREVWNFPAVVLVDLRAPLEFGAGTPSGLVESLEIAPYDGNAPSVLTVSGRGSNVAGGKVGT
jgi:hypothetical protein